ncbi:MAG: hypothetical protein V4594_16730 [Bacteroidota bacterium]
MTAENNLVEYVDYFRQLAVRHSDLRHNEAAETGDAPASEMHFAKWNLNEITGSLRTKLSFPAVLLELYENQTAGSTIYNIKQRPKGALTILQHVKEGSIRDEEAAYTLTEKILYDFLKQIWQDHYAPSADRCETPFYQFDYNGLHITPTPKLFQNEMGWRVEFPFVFQNTIDIKRPPEAGTFIDYVVADYTNVAFATAYVDYFRQLAVSHYLLRHNQAAETGDAPASQGHFTKWNANELVGGLRTKCSFPGMLLELYETDPYAETVYDVKPRSRGAFTILQHVKEGDLRGEEAAYALAESIMYNILQQMWQDHYSSSKDRCKTPFYQFGFNNLDIVSTGKILENEMGWRVEFYFEFQRAYNVMTPPDPGAFIDNEVFALGDDEGFLDADDLINTLLLTE